MPLSSLTSFRRKKATRSYWHCCCWDVVFRVLSTLPGSVMKTESGGDGSPSNYRLLFLVLGHRERWSCSHPLLGGPTTFLRRDKCDRPQHRPQARPRRWLVTVMLNRCSCSFQSRFGGDGGADKTVVENYPRGDIYRSQSNRFSKESGKFFLPFLTKQSWQSKETLFVCLLLLRTAFYW